MLVAGESRGSLEILAPVVTALAESGVDVRVAALGTKQEAAALGSLGYVHVLKSGELPSLLDGVDCVIVGVTGQASKETSLCLLARQRQIPSVGIVDNIHDMSCRINSDPGCWPTHVLISGGTPALVREQLQHFPRKLSEDFLERTVFVGNLRTAVRSTAGSSPDGEFALAQMLNHTHVQWPNETLKSKASKGIFDGKLTPVAYFSNNIHWQAPHWKSYGYSEEYLKQSYGDQLRLTEIVLRELALRPDTQAIVRPHPAESDTKTRSLSKAHDALYVPHTVCHSLQLAIACGHAISPPSGVVDICAFNGVRCLLVTPADHNSSMIYAAQIGAVQAVDESDEIGRAIKQLIDRSSDANERWKQRHHATASVENPISKIVEKLFALSTRNA